MNFISIDARKALADLDDPRAPIPIKRTVAADLVAALIDWLDLLDGDPDLEPSLGAPHDPGHGQEHWAAGDRDEREWAVDDDGEDDADREPSLGSAGAAIGTGVEPMGFLKVKPYWMTDEEWQASLRRHDAVMVLPVADWAQGDADDCEGDEHDGAEPDNEDGPSWNEGFSQAGILRNWCSGSEDDEEGDPAGGDVQDEPHDAELDLREGEDWEDREYSAGVDCEEAMTTEWTPERPGEEVVDGQEYTRPRKAQIDRRKLLRDVGQGSQGHFHGLVLNAMPERYRMQVEGDCLFPEILSGACLEFSSTEKPAYGDFVAIYRRAQFVKPGEWQVVVKRLLVDWREGEVTPVIFRDGKPRSVGPCVEVEMLNPPKRLFYLADQIEAVHKMVRIVPEEERGAKLNAAEMVALKLVA